MWGDFDAGWSPATVGTVAAVRPDADSQGIHDGMFGLSEYDWQVRDAEVEKSRRQL
jgi:hypothetical protein